MKQIKSLTGRCWEILSDINHENILRLLAKNRNITDIDKFLNISVKNTMPDPFVFIDMEKAIDRIVKAILEKQKIAILGDYDVDGISSVAVFAKFFEEVGALYTTHIPHRVNDGYGLNISNIENYKDCLIIAVDCGSSSFEELAYARQNDIDIIVLDHHTMKKNSNDAVAIVNAHRPDEKDDYKYLCATGLVFICVVGLNRALRQIRFYNEHIQEPNLLNYLDIVALATVCDVVPLLELNRAFVITGLKIIRQKTNLGINSLLSTYNGNIDSETISFFLGPRLNASGRVASGNTSLKLLLSKDQEEADSLAKELESMNSYRQSIEREIVEQVIDEININRNFICAYNSDWHIGVIGIVAGRLKETFNKLSIVITDGGSGCGKASCRSIDGVDISSLIKKAIDKEIILSGGGHAAAAGFTISLNKIADLENFLEEEVDECSEKPKLIADCVISLSDVSESLINEISKFEPFGMCNQRPKFIIKNVRILSTRVVGEKHITSVLCDDFGNQIKSISFNCLGTVLGKVLMDRKESIDVLGAVQLSSWRGKQYINLQLEDVSSCNFI